MADRLTKWLPYVRGKVNTLLVPDRCTIEEWLTERNARGQEVNLRVSVVAADVPCRLAPVDLAIAGNETGGVYGRGGELIDTSADQWTLALPWGTRVEVSWHIVMQDRAVYEVNDVRDASTFGSEVVCRLVRLGVDQPGGA